MECAALRSWRCLGACVALLKSVGKAHVEVNAARAPYINHHMSSSLNKMYSSLCCAWTTNGNKCVSVPLTFNISPNCFGTDLPVTCHVSLSQMCKCSVQSEECVLLVLFIWLLIARLSESLVVECNSFTPRSSRQCRSVMPYITSNPHVCYL